MFDVGETLFNEERLWGLWADWLKVPRPVFLAALDDVIARREHHRAVFDVFSPGVDVESARRARERAGWPADILAPEDVYPDAAPCVVELASLGFRVGVAANQPSAVGETIRALELPFDFICTSESWGAAKPAPEFFHRVVETAGVPAASVAYVGDRVDNDVIPARSAGLVAVFLRRGPWGAIHATWPEVSAADVRIDDLTELPNALMKLDHAGSP